MMLYVRNDLFNNRDLPDIRNRQYFPTISTVRTHMVSARIILQLSVINQEALIEKNPIWKQENPSIEIFFRPKGKEAVNNDDTKDNIEVEEQEMKLTMKILLTMMIELKVILKKKKKKKKESKKLNLRMKILSIPCSLFTKQIGNVVFFNVMVEKCYCWTQRTKQHDIFYLCSFL